MKPFLITIVLSFLTYSEIICQKTYELKFEKSEKSYDTDTIKTLESLKKIGDVFYFTYYGDYKNILTNLNTFYKENPFDTIGFRCSVYSALGDRNHIILGRNFDNPEKGIIISKFYPSNGYSSICITGMDDLGYDRYLDLSKLTLKEKSGILKAPFYTCDGINEKGLSASIAWIPSQKINPDNKKEKIFITLLLRIILDNAQNINEAIALANKYDVYDKNLNFISHHFLITDRNGQSLIIEYKDGKMQFIKTSYPYQIITNTYVGNYSEDYKRLACYRYTVLSKDLETKNGILNNSEAMDLLCKVAGENPKTGATTLWSAVYDLNRQIGYVSVYRNFDIKYVFKLNE